MTSQHNPGVSLGGQPLDVDRLQWPLKTGGRAGRMTVTVAEEIGARLREKMLAKTAVSLEINTDVEPQHKAGGRGIQNVVIQRLFIVAETPAPSRFQSQFTVVDWRFLFEQELFTGTFNLRRLGSDRKALQGKRFVRNLPGGSPADFEAAAQFRYLPHSLKDGLQDRPLRDFRGENAKVWKATEILRYLLQRYSEAGFLVDTSRAEESGYQPEQLEFEGQPLPGVIDAMLSVSRNGMFVRPDGTLQVFGVTDTSIDKIYPPKFPFEGSGWPINPDKRAHRPARVRVQFVKEHEIRFDFAERAAQEGQSVAQPVVPPFNLENVLPLPDTIGGRIRGTFVTIEEALSLWNSDTKNPVSSNLKKKPSLYRSWNIPAVRKGFLSSRMEFFALDIARFPSNYNPILTARVATLRQHYRQTYRILPAWMDRIQSWKPELVTVVDPITHQRQPALVLQDYTIAYSQKALHHPDIDMREQVLHGQQVEGYSATIDDAARVPAIVQTVNQDLGIFSIDFYQDLQRYVGQIIPSPVDNIPFIAFSELGQHIWEQAELSPDFDLSVLIACVFSVPNKDDRLYEVTKTPGDLGLGDPSNNQIAKEIFSRRQTAGYRWTDKSKATLTANGVEVTGSPLENSNILDAIAEAESERFYYHQKDRAIGTYALTGWEGSDFYPSGNAQGVAITFDRGGLFTTIDLNQPPIPKSFMELLPPSVRKFLFRQLPGI